jgi:hypothetical protein
MTLLPHIGFAFLESYCFSPKKKKKKATIFVMSEAHCGEKTSPRDIHLLDINKISKHYCNSLASIGLISCYFSNK